MAAISNDTPIENVEDDLYGMADFARAVARGIRDVRDPLGTTVALYGPWGSGKSSVVNLVKAELAADASMVVTDFRCWWFRGEDALTLAFFQMMKDALGSDVERPVQDALSQIGGRLMQARGMIGAGIDLAGGGGAGKLATGGIEWLSRLFPEGDSLEDSHRRLQTALEDSPKQYLVVVDDIDRLSPDEALAVFRLVKSVGRLPNVTYLLVFDRQLAERAVAERYPSEGPHFLEKIVQAGFELPEPTRTDLNRAIFQAINEVCNLGDEQVDARFWNLFHDILAPCLASPRAVTRYRGAISVTWPAIGVEINLSDFLALEALRLNEGRLFERIRQKRHELCGTRSSRGDRSRSERMRPFLVDVPETRHAFVDVTLQRLFPAMEEMGYGGDWVSVWEAERRICIERYFDAYFRLSLDENALPRNEIDELVSRADDPDFVRSKFLEGARATRGDGTSRVPLYLDELNVRASDISLDAVPVLLQTLFSIHDEIDLERDRDRGFMGMANTTLRYHWLIRRLTAKLGLVERDALYERALADADLGWRVDFCSSAYDDHHPREDGRSTPEDQWLVSREALDVVVQDTLRAIQSAAADETLLRHRDLIYILYRWRDFTGSFSEPRAWTDSMLGRDDAIVILAGQLTDESASAAIGGLGSGLGDRVATRTVRVRLTEDSEMIDTATFVRRLGEARDRLSNDDASAIDVFLEAWNRQSSDFDSDA